MKTYTCALLSFVLFALVSLLVVGCEDDDQEESTQGAPVVNTSSVSSDSGSSSDSSSSDTSSSTLSQSTEESKALVIVAGVGPVKNAMVRYYSQNGATGFAGTDSDGHATVPAYAEVYEISASGYETWTGSSTLGPSVTWRVWLTWSG